MKKIFLVDVSSLFFRAFYALPPMTNKKGLPTNSLYGLLNMTLRLINEKKPDYMAFCFDRKEPSFRADLYKDYKANRGEMPEDLVLQVPYIKKLVSCLGIKALEKASFEADDIIGTLVKKFSDDYKVTIVSGDKDFAQLISKNVKMFDSMKNKVYNEAGVKEKWGIFPEQMIDYLALVGDSSDNIPGVKGIGPKTATKLLEEYSTLEGIYQNIDKISTKALKAKLVDNLEMAQLSKKLVTIINDIPLDVSIDELLLTEIEKQPMLELLEELEFKNFEKKIFQSENTVKAKKSNSSHSSKNSNEKVRDVSVNFDSMKERVSVEEIKTKIAPYSEVVVLNASNEGLTIFNENKLYYLVPELLTQYGPVLEKKHLKWRGYDLKSIWHRLNCYDYNTPYEDLMLTAYVLKPGKIGSFFETIENYLEVKVDQETLTAEEELHFYIELSKLLSKEISFLQGKNILDSIEKPLVPVLLSMEKHGIVLNANELDEQSKELIADIKSLEIKIQEMAEVEFNVASPKQLSEVLFDKLKLPIIKKTKTGYSTDNSVLEKLAKEHKICQFVIHFRELSKLNSTYVSALPNLINKKTKRLHTHFNQTLTSTGRLSSTDPNLQNIPIRTKRGRLVRKAFEAEEGHLLLSVDYSQIELRILAHMSEDIKMIEAFEKNIDIHQATASQIFQCPLSEVNPEMRRKAKAVNFGIAYGQGVFGLAETLSIERSEAKEIIENYFNRFPGIKNYMAKTIEEAKEKGFVETLLGRRRYINELNSKSVRTQKFGERAAINAPIQGTASDIVKLAMIKVFEEVESPILLQVHDELILEVNESSLDDTQSTVKEIMETIVTMKVPLKVNMAWGRNWEEAHS